jgi:hypothetical protein
VSESINRRAHFIRLVEVAENSYPYVTAERLRSLARSSDRWLPLAPEIGALLREALDARILLSDRRTRISRSGALRPVRIYRLNRVNPSVSQTLETTE